MHSADEERTPRERPAPDVHVRGHTGVGVHDPPVMMHMRRAGRAAVPFPRLVNGAPAKYDQHYGHRELEEFSHTR
jgi:hypothetical protein